MLRVDRCKARGCDLPQVKRGGGWSKRKEKELWETLNRQDWSSLFSPMSPDRLYVPIFQRPGRGLHFRGARQTWEWV